MASTPKNAADWRSRMMEPLMRLRTSGFCMLASLGVTDGLEQLLKVGLERRVLVDHLGEDALLVLRLGALHDVLEEDLKHLVVETLGAQPLVSVHALLGGLHAAGERGDERELAVALAGQQ